MSIKKIVLSLITLSTITLMAQTHSGIHGKRTLIGYKGNMWAADQAIFLGQFYLEKMVSNNTHIGFSFGKFKTEAIVSDFAINNSDRVTTVYNGKKYYVIKDKVWNSYNVKSNTIEFNIKKYKRSNEMKHFGWFFNYKIGRHFITTELPSGTQIGLGLKPDEYSFSIFTSGTAKYKHSQSYIGFEIGQTIPILNENFLLSYSGALNFNFEKNLKGEMTFVDYSKSNISKKVFLTQLYSFNLSIAHVL